jgi:hypothetical protein
MNNQPASTTGVKRKLSEINGDIVEAKSARGAWWPVVIRTVHPNGTADVRVLDGIPGTQWRNMAQKNIREAQAWQPPEGLPNTMIPNFGPNMPRSRTTERTQEDIWFIDGNGTVAKGTHITTKWLSVTGGEANNNTYYFKSSADAEAFNSARLIKETAIKEAALERRTAERKAHQVAYRLKFVQDEEAITAGMETMAKEVLLTPVKDLEVFLRKHVNIHMRAPPKYANHRDKWCVGKAIPTSRAQHEAFAYKTHDGTVHIVWLKRAWKKILKTEETKKHWVVTSTVVGRPIPQRPKTRRRG